MNTKILKNSMMGIAILSGIGIFASPLKAHASVIPYSIGVIEPENSLNQSYFDLVLGAGKTQTVNVEVANNSDKEITLETYIAPARTESSGAVIYYNNTDKNDSSLKYDISKYTKIDSKITIPAGKAVKEPIKITMPSDKFDGVMAGGIVFKEKNQNLSTPNDDSKGIAVKNEYQSTVGLLLRQNKNEVKPKVNFGKIEAGQVNGRNVVNAHIQNSEMAYIDNVSINAKIVDESDAKNTFVYSNQNMQIAPNSSFDLPIPISTSSGKDGYSEPLKAGKYKATLVVYGNAKGEKTKQGEQSDYKWTTTKEFTVTSDEARQLNKLDVTLNPKEKTGHNWIIISVVIVLVLAIAGGVTWYVLRRKKRKG